jgi:hypothetical protein
LRATARSSTSTDTPVAFRAAIKEHFAQIARADGRYPLHELQRQFAYDRVLARLFSSDHADRWVLKGAGALLARLATARHSEDIDVLFEVSDADVDDAVAGSCSPADATRQIRVSCSRTIAASRATGIAAA